MLGIVNSADLCRKAQSRLHDDARWDLLIFSVFMAGHTFVAKLITVPGVTSSDWLTVLCVAAGGVFATAAFVLTPLAVVIALPSGPLVDALRGKFLGQLAKTFTRSTLIMFLIGLGLCLTALVQRSVYANAARAVGSGLLAWCTVLFWRILTGFRLAIAGAQADRAVRPSQT